MDKRITRTAQVAREFIPPAILRPLTGLLGGWKGNYPSWEDAKKQCTGYDDAAILEKVTASALKVKNGEAPYERDSVLFDKIQLSFPVLAGLLWIASRNGDALNVLDFGGSLGSSFYQNRQFLESLKEFNWCIVEQPHFVTTGREKFEGGPLRFFPSIDECRQFCHADVVLLSSVLQYLEEPYALLDTVFSTSIPYIIIDRTFFLENGDDRITVQTVPSWIYKAKYPCWFFNEQKFLGHFSSRYRLVTDFTLPDQVNIRSVYKGFIFERRQP